MKTIVIISLKVFFGIEMITWQKKLEEVVVVVVESLYAIIAIVAIN